MLYLKRPENQRIRHWLDEQAAQPLSYSQVGMTSSDLMPGGYHHINHEVCIGQGRLAFQAAKEALGQWGCFNLPWMRLLFDGNPEPGNHLAIAAQVASVWTVHCTRVVACNGSSNNPNLWSFTVGTLPRHMLRGEEQISVTLDSVSGNVLYRIRSFSRPNQRLANVFLKLSRHQQKRLCEESTSAIKRYVRARERIPMGEPVKLS